MSGDPFRFTLRDLGPARVRQVAYHEAGHAVAHAVLGLNPGRVTIDTGPDDPLLGRAASQDFGHHRVFADVAVPHDTSKPAGDPPLGPIEGVWRAWLVFSGLRNSTVATLAGPLAELRIILETEPGITWDDVWSIASDEADDPGADYSKVDAALMRIEGTPAQAAAVGDRWRAEADALLTEHWPAVERLAAALIEHGTVSGDDVRDLVWGDA